MSNMLGGYPYEVTTEEGCLVVRFYPKAEGAEYPDNPVLKLPLSSDDCKKLMKLLIDGL